jgi:DNA-binding NtrC family response regulator
MPANRVLIVDDDHWWRQTWVLILGLEGYQVSSVILVWQRLPG